MKKTLLAIVMVMSSYGFANAQSIQDEPANNPIPVAVQDSTTKYNEVKLEDLSEKAQEAIKKLEETYTVKALAFDAEKAIIKVSLVSKADNKEKEILLTKDGEEYKEEKEA